MKKRLMVACIVAALVIASAASIYYLDTMSIARDQPAIPQAYTVASCVWSPGYFLIIADIRGFNDSVGHIQNSPNEPWPVITVHKGDRVNILVCNEDEYSPHGFAINHYFDAGIPLMPHQSFRVSFVADQVGAFTIYCNIFCPIHAYMQSGQLLVTQ